MPGTNLEVEPQEKTVDQLVQDAERLLLQAIIVAAENGCLEDIAQTSAAYLNFWTAKKYDRETR
jgi:hypothetical protein